MDYIREATERLRYLKDLYKANENLRDTILDLRLKCQGKEITLDGMPAGSSSINYDDTVVNNMFKLQESEERLQENKAEIKKINKELSGLEEQDRNLLIMWYVDDVDIQEMCKRFICSQTELYRRRSRVIRQFARQLFGIRVIK